MEKRSSKLFGGRISSIFNAHTHGSSHNETGLFHHTSETADQPKLNVASDRFHLPQDSDEGSRLIPPIENATHHRKPHESSQIQPQSPVNAEYSNPQTPANNSRHHHNRLSAQLAAPSSGDSLFPSPQVSSVLGSPMRPLSSKPLQNSSRVSGSPAYLVNLGPVPYSPTRLTESGIPEHSEFEVTNISPSGHRAPRRKPPPDLMNSEFDFVGPVYSMDDVGSPVSASKDAKFEDNLSNVADFRDIIEKIESEITDGSGLNYHDESSGDDEGEIIGTSSRSRSTSRSPENSEAESDTPYRHQAPLTHAQYFHSREDSTEPPNEEDINRNEEDDDGDDFKDEFLITKNSSRKDSYTLALETRSNRSEEDHGIMAQVPYPINDIYARQVWNDNGRIDSFDNSLVQSPSVPYPAGPIVPDSSTSSSTSLELSSTQHPQQQPFVSPKIAPTRTLSQPSSIPSQQQQAAALMFSPGGIITPCSSKSNVIGKSDSIRTTNTNASSTHRVPFNKGPARQKSVDTVSGLNTVELRAKSSISRSLGHRKTGSIGSFQSLNSNRNVNLATLKKSFNLRPGEGERSIYVTTIRKSSGAANNDTGPGKWKLPTALQVIDRSAIQTAKYLRSAGSKYKKSSGVELKHGHLERRLLRSEADDFDDSEIGARSPLARSGTETSKILTHVLSTNTDASQATILTSNTYSSTSSVDRTSLVAHGTTTSNNTTINSSEQNNELLDAEATSSSNATQLERASSVSSSSSGSVSSSMAAGVYYQHPGYNTKSDEEINASIASAPSTLNYDDNESLPRLVLVNPDGDD